MLNSAFKKELDELYATCVRLHEDLEALRDRIERVEAQHAPGADRPTAKEAHPPPLAREPGPTPHYAEPQVSETPPVHDFSPQDRSDRDRVNEELRAASTPGPKDLGRLVQPLHTPAQAEAHEEPGARDDMELRIGGTWLNRVGALVLFLGVAFFAKYSFDQGWISPTLRILVAGAAGLALVGVGEYCLYREMRTFAGGLLGCGVCVLYLSVYGAHGLYGLIGSTTASALYMGVTAVCVLVSVHGRLLPVAVLGLLGGFATPILLSTGENRQVELLVYVLVLDIGFLASASIRRWDVLRPLCWIGTFALFFGWYDRFYDEAALWRTAGFLLAFYLLFQGELVLCLRRRSAQRPEWIGHLVRANNVAFFASTYFLLHDAIPQWMGLFAVSMAGAQWLTAWRLCGRDEVSSHARRSFWLDGAAMLALAAPMQFDRYMVSISWAVQSVVTLWFCRRITDGWLRAKGAGVWLAAVAHLIVFDHHDSGLGEIIASLGHWHVSPMILCFVLVGLSGYGAAATLLVGRAADERDKSLAAFLTVLGTALLMGIFADQWERYVATWWWLGLGVAWWAVATRVPAARVLAVLIALVTCAKFLVWDTAHAALRGVWSGIDGLVVNRAVITGVCAAAATALVRPMADRWSDRVKAALDGRAVGPIVTVAIALVITWTGTFEVARAFHFEPMVTARFDNPAHARWVFVTAFWAINAAVLLLLATPKHHVLSAYTLALTWLTILKLLSIDTLLDAGTGSWSQLDGLCTNRTFLVGVLVTVVGLWAYRRAASLKVPGTTGLQSQLLSPTMLKALLAVVTLLVTWIPTFEICRVFRFEPFRNGFSDPRLAMHVALSVFWGINATGLLVLGFIRRIGLLRYMALALYALTVVKIFVVDLGRLDMIYRIVSFIVLGVLLLFASWLYQRLSSRLAVETP